MQTVLIVGGGVVGLISALRLATSGVPCVILEEKPWGYWRADGRQFALAYDVIQWLSVHAIVPIEKFWRITQAALSMDERANILEFHSNDAKLAYLGGMICESALMTHLVEQVSRMPLIQFLCGRKLISIVSTACDVCIEDHQHHRYVGSLCIASDGKNSWVRKQMNISCFEYAFSQYATNVIVGFEGNPRTVWDVFSENQCIGILPIAPDRAACIVMEPTGRVTFPMLLQRINTALNGRLVLTSNPQSYRSYPLSAGWALSYTKHTVLLLGDAALWLHPMMGQGLNIALRHAAPILDAIPDLLTIGYDIQRWLRHLPSRDGAVALGINGSAILLQGAARFLAWRALSFCANFPQFTRWCIRSGCTRWSP